MGRTAKRDVIIAALPTALFPLGCAAIIGLEDTTTITDFDQPDATTEADNEAAPRSDAGANDAAEASTEPRCDEDNLVGHWRFDEGSGGLTHDCTSNMIVGRLAAATWAEGRPGSALLFASAWVVFAKHPLLRINGALTLAAWIRNDAVTGKTQYVIGKTAGGVQPLDGWRLAVDKTSQLSMSIGTGSAVAETIGGAVLPLGKWTHVASTYEPSMAVRLYVDGAAIATDTTNIPVSSAIATDDLHVGARSDGEYPFAGAIDEVQIYDKALTATEVAALAR